jgi:hypothetical protein
MATIEGQEIDLMPTEGMKEEAQRYRDWKAEGRDERRHGDHDGGMVRPA